MFLHGRVGRLREVPRPDGTVEVRWGDYSKGMADAAELVENPGGWGALTESQQKGWCAP